MSLGVALARVVNRILPSGWRLHHPSALPLPAPAPPAAEWVEPDSVDLVPMELTPVEADVNDAGASRQRLYAYLSADCALTELHDGHFIFVDPADKTMTPQFVARGYWETWVEQVVLGLLRPGDRVVEVGANHGYYTLQMAAKVGAEGHIDAFEANPRLADLLGRSISFNNYDPRVTLHRKAVLDRTGTASFSLSREDSGSGNVLGGGRDAETGRQVLEVESVRLDDVFPTGRIDLIRTDAEGSEPLIVCGAWGLIDRNPDIVLCMEWSVPMMQERMDVRQFADQLATRGFRFWKIEIDSSLTESTAAAMAHLSHCDVVMARRHPLERPEGPPAR